VFPHELLRTLDTRSQVEPGTQVTQFLSDPAIGEVPVDQLCQTMHHRAWRQQLSEKSELNGTRSLPEWWGTSALDLSDEGI